MIFKNIRNLTLYTKRNSCYQAKFRKLLIEKYRECPITKTHESLCDAAHILPYVKCSEYDRFNLNNGILLAKHIHRAFDKKYFTFDHITCKVKILYKNVEKNNIYNLETIGLENKDGLYIKELDNRESRVYLSMINKYDTRYDNKYD